MCSTEQKSLVFIDIDSLTFNETALQELGLLESQVLVVLLIFLTSVTDHLFLDALIIGRND